MSGSDGDQTPLGILRRWEDGGGGWRVTSSVGGRLRIELVTCTGDEVVGSLESDDSALADHVGGRTSHPD